MVGYLVNIPDCREVESIGKPLIFRRMVGFYAADRQLAKLENCPNPPVGVCDPPELVGLSAVRSKAFFLRRDYGPVLAAGGASGVARGENHAFGGPPLVRRGPVLARGGGSRRDARGSLPIARELPASSQIPHASSDREGPLRATSSLIRRGPSLSGGGGGI